MKDAAVRKRLFSFKKIYREVPGTLRISKNPIIASFFRNIGWSDRLGSGVRNIFKYSKYYSGKEPEFIEGDVFRIIVPLNEDYSYDNPQNDSIDELERENEEKLEKNQKRFGESSEKVRRKIGERSDRNKKGEHN